MHASARLTPAARRELVRRVFDTPLRKQRLRDLRATLRRYRGCLDALPARGRRALELRGGLLGRQPASRREIARLIDMSPGGVVRLERSALRRLTGAGRRGACGGDSASVAAAARGTDPGGATTVPSGENEGGGGISAPHPTGAGEVLADVHEGGPGVDLGDGEDGALETVLTFLVACIVVLGPLAVVAARRRRAGERAAPAAIGGAAAPARPLLFLDVDGVIALSPFLRRPPPGRLLELSPGLTYVPDRVGRLVRRLATRFDLVWATGWEHHANVSLVGPLGLDDELPVVVFGRSARFGSSEWKIERVDRYAGNRPAAWLDDNFLDRHDRWAAGRAEPTLLVPVDPHTGLTSDHVEQLLGWADRLELQSYDLLGVVRS